MVLYHAILLDLTTSMNVDDTIFVMEQVLLITTNSNF